MQPDTVPVTTPAVLVGATNQSTPPTACWAKLGNPKSEIQAGTELKKCRDSHCDVQIGTIVGQSGLNNRPSTYRFGSLGTPVRIFK